MTTARNDGPRPWEQHKAGRREQRHVPLPAVDEMGDGVIAMSTFEVTQKLGAGELGVHSALERQMDGWVSVTDPTTYDPLATYTRSTNKHDHMTVLHVPVPRDVAVIMDMVIERLPQVSNRNEFIRDAIVHNLWRWYAVMAEVDEGWTRKLHLETYACVQERIEVEVDQWMGICKRAESMMEKIAEIGDMDTLREALDFHGALAEQAPEPWRGKVNAIVARWRRRLTDRENA